MAQPYLTTRCSAYNSWLPQTNLIHNQFVLKLHSRPVSSNGHKAAVDQFDSDITKEQKELFEGALTQWADEKSIVKDWEGFLNLLDGIVESPPSFYKAELDGVTIGEPIGVPLYLILDLVSNTSAAYTLFTEKSFNKALRDLLNSWGAYLKTKESNVLLTREFWFSEQGLAVLESGLGKWTFWQTYEIDITDKPDGPFYNSWDSFFIRQFKAKNPDGGDVRPIQRASGGRFFVNSACKSTVLRTAKNAWLHDTFWLKEQNYSIYDMLGGTQEHSLAPQYAKEFEDASIYQAFLSPADYHRWHSPVKGNIKASHVFPGTYYAVLPDNGAPPYDPDLEPGDPHGAMIRSQPWLSIAAARAVYIIEPTDPDLHLSWIAFIAIGMVEVSTCHITKKSGAVDVGEEIGMFHFGGSSHTLLLKPEEGYEVVFQDVYNSPLRPGQHRWINSGIAQVRKIDKK